MRTQQFASPQEALEHFGVKGMHWGVRKERVSNVKFAVNGTVERTTKTGEKFTLTQKPPNAVQKSLAFASESYARNLSNQAYLTIKDKDGKKIGSGSFWYDKEDPKAVYLNWITVKSHARGNGYASEILKAAEEHSRAAGKERMILEVPGISPDARHIYDKMGFKVIKEPTEKERKSDSVWGGLTHMEKRLNN